MNILCPSFGTISTISPRRGSADVADAGFDHILLNLDAYCTAGELEAIGKKQKKKNRDALEISKYPQRLCDSVKPMWKQCGEKGLQITVAYAPYLVRNTKHVDLNDLLLTLAKESIKVCGMIGCKYLVVRPLFAGIGDSDLWERNHAYYMELARDAKQQGVQLLLENQCRDLNGHLVRGICAESQEAALWVDRLNGEAGEERFGFCMDVGVCNLCGQNMYDFILAMGDRLKAVVLRDGDGSQESALLPFSCAVKGASQTDWLNLIRGLRETAFDGELIMSIYDTLAAYSWLFKPDLLRFSRKIAGFFEWQIQMEAVIKKYPSRVLFGAGNMCRNYMKCYGEKYPPLFTCDNNKEVWGTNFCGLAVKSPESLRDLPKDCAVFICNIYYREIAQQLRDMGLCNPIEYFNDEYMPSFYLERLEMSRFSV